MRRTTQLGIAVSLGLAAGVVGASPSAADYRVCISRGGVETCWSFDICVGPASNPRWICVPFDSDGDDG